MRITGYGKGWQEEKQTGIKRLFQMLREPSTKTTYYALAFWMPALVIFIMLISGTL